MYDNENDFYSYYTRTYRCHVPPATGLKLIDDRARLKHETAKEEKLEVHTDGGTTFTSYCSHLANDSLTLAHADTNHAS